MVFSNAVFLMLFLPLTILVYYSPLCRSIKIRNLWLLLVSLGFYAWGEPIYIVLMLLSILMNYILGRIVEPHAKTGKGKFIVLISCLYNLGMLFVFKYAGWLLGDMFGIIPVDSALAKLTLPIGISFYTFQALSYVVDVYRGKDKAQKNIINMGLYIAFFPQLVAGPIVRYNDVAKQLSERRHDWDHFSEGVCRFIIGLSKKVLIANSVASVAKAAFSANGSELSVILAWTGALAYTIQIYFDFSGYSDMAIGLGKMFGFDFLENFNYPYVSTSVSEYWRRWHMSLGGWFRDYVYYPLFLGPAMKLRTALVKKWGWKKKSAGIVSDVFILFVVWMSTGIWHGANMTFVLWGFIQFAALVWEKYKKPFKNKKVGCVVGFICTFMVVMVTKIIFNANSLSHAFSYYASMFHLNSNAVIDNYGLYWLDQYKVFLIAGMIFCFPVVETIRDRLKTESGQKIYGLITTIALMVLFFVDICFAMGGGYNPFIYFNF